MSIIDQYCEDMAKQIDEANIEFLAQNGYKIEKPYTIEKIKQLQEQLDKEGKVFAYHWEYDTITQNNDDTFTRKIKLKQDI